MVTNNVRSCIYQQIVQNLIKEKNLNPLLINSHFKLSRDISNETYVFSIPLKTRSYNLIEEVGTSKDYEIPNVSTDIIVTDDHSAKTISFSIKRNVFIKNVLSTSQLNIAPVFAKPQKVIVEFSSPNIAKPFHVGHLRSTILGNFITNINKYLGNKVVKLNYLGDWGTQFGFVQLGIRLSNISEETIQNDPIRTLYDAYVYANKLAGNDPRYEDEARKIFHSLENGDETGLLKWEIFRKYTLEDLRKTYSRLGINFDQYDWESMYSKSKISNFISQLEKLDIFKTDSDNKKVICLDNCNKTKTVPLIKSDGSTLYITRDLAAAIDRYERYQFDSMYYVVDNSQNKHFVNIIEILTAMKYPWTDRLQHIKFGRIRGMSTRKGEVIFLQDILDELQSFMKEKQLKSQTTKIDPQTDNISSEILGISAMIIHDFKHKKGQDYEFNWDKVLSLTSNSSGVKLQYTHCRLCSLEDYSGAHLPHQCDPSVLTESVVDDLILTIAKFDETLIYAYTKLEPSILVNYLFDLSRDINKVFNELKIKGEDEHLASQRLLLMHYARKTLSTGMKMLGIVPLNKM